MAKLRIDFGGTACAGGCEHCRFGTAQGGQVQVFSEESLAMLNRLVVFANQQGVSVRLSYMSPFWNMAEVPPVAGEIETVSVSLLQPEDLDEHGEVIFNNLSSFGGKAIELGLNHYPAARFEIEKHLSLVYRFQLKLFTALPQLKEVFFGLNHNTAKESVKEIRDSAMMLVLAYMEWVEASFQEKDFGDNQVVITGGGGYFGARAFVRYNEKQFGLGCRYLLAHDVGEAARLEGTFGHDGDLSLALLGTGVHVGHSTYTINNPIYWFTYTEFGDLVSVAEQEGLSLIDMCERAIAGRTGRIPIHVR